MPDSVRCPNPMCGRPIQRPDSAPASLCPHCGKPFCLDVPVETATRNLPAGGAVTQTLPPMLPERPWAAGPTPLLDVPEYIGRFVIRRFLGEGAFGRVYEAHDPQLDRVIALKVAKQELMHSENRVQRFLREAKAAANLRHPHIVPVFDSGSDAGHFYIASAFIPGRSLDKHLEELPEGQMLEMRRAVQIVRRLAEALAYAHKRKVIHRDVKPANVMLDEGGEPLLMDFGLAARDEGGEKLTQEGVKGMGTPAYMAPEQGAGEAVAASDQYSLGCTLYELLTGQTPFAGPPELQMFLHQRHEPVSPLKINRCVPRDLEAVCVKCLEKEPAKRYEDCQVLADDLRRWLDGEPVRARRPGAIERLKKWARRSPAVAGLSLAVAVVLVAGATVATFFGIRAEKNATTANEKAEEERKAKEQVKAEKANVEKEKANVVTEQKETEKALKKSQFEEAKAKFVAYSFRLGAARQRIESGDHSEAMKELRLCETGLRGWEHDYLIKQCPEELWSVRQGLTVTSVAYSPDGKRVVSASAYAGTVQVWDAATGQEALSFKGSTGQVHSVAFSPDGKRIVAGIEDVEAFTPDMGLRFPRSDWTVKVWDAATGKETLSFKSSTEIRSVAFSPDGKRVVLGGNWTVKVHDATTGQEALTLKGNMGLVYSVAFSPDAKRIVTGNEDGVTVWDAATGQKTRSPDGYKSPVHSVVFSPDGKHIVAGKWDRSLSVWDAGTGREVRTLYGHTGPVCSVAFSLNGKHVLSGDRDGTVKIWDAATGEVMRSFKAHTRSVRSVAFSPDGKRIVSGGEYQQIVGTVGEIKMWDTAPGQETLSQEGHLGTVLSVAFSPDGKRIVSGGGTARDKPGEVKVWDAATSQEILSIDGHKGWVHSVAFSPDGKRVVSRSYWLVKVNDAATGQDSLNAKMGLGYATFSPDGKRIVTGDIDGNVTVWDAATGQKALSLDGQTGPVYVVAFSQDGKRIITGNRDANVTVWDAATGQRILNLDTGPLCSISFSPDGRHMVSGNLDGTVKVWDLSSLKKALSFKGHALWFSSVAFSPDSKRVVLGSHDKTMKLWDFLIGQEALSLKGHTELVSCVVFSPDGKRIVSGSDDGTLKVWDAATGQEALSFKGHTGKVHSLAFSPDGKRIVSGGRDRYWSGEVKVWGAAMHERPVRP